MRSGGRGRTCRLGPRGRLYGIVSVRSGRHPGKWTVPTAHFPAWSARPGRAADTGDPPIQPVIGRRSENLSTI